MFFGLRSRRRLIFFKGRVLEFSLFALKNYWRLLSRLFLKLELLWQLCWKLNAVTNENQL